MQLIQFIIGGLFIIGVFIAGFEYGNYQKAKESRMAELIKNFKQS